ncbi:hypothetical protein B0H17DRAFT_960598 [Mycena rosella]|uniref:DUF2306 domain-containing protein n=1 Tax=Mycena rosella TaxID=1033263 RepID=A0AAD7C6J4_MYCRO|nr:hypothetical protein B0H17DRAFT_960598 [Mycena rosella]
MSSYPPNNGTGRPNSLAARDLFNLHSLDGGSHKGLQANAEIPSLLRLGAGRRQPLASFYRSLSWILGFRDKYSLLNCFICGGALVGFCLARSMTMNPGRIADLLVPGEWFWFRQPLYKVNLFIHIYLTTIGGIFALIQFFPTIRTKKIVIHRLNGYGVLFCLIVGNISGAIIGRRSFGGELTVQSAYYILGIMVVFAALLGGYYARKDTRRHRKWMLRMVAYFAAAITERLVQLSARQIITDIGTYYTVCWIYSQIATKLMSAAMEV